MLINGLSRVIGLIGNPVEHTLSPVIHNTISEGMNISSVYVPFKVEKEGLVSAIEGAYELNILGLNVTVPYKTDVIKVLADIDQAAEHIGAVNTLVRQNDIHGYKGYNTDMSGLRRQIKEDGIELNGRNVVVLGAGGAAKAVVYMCLLEGAGKIYLLNRTISKAEEIADNDLINGKVLVGEKRVIPMKMTDYNNIKESELVVFQATSIGLYPNSDKVVISDPMFYDKIDVGVDLIYNPAQTQFLKLVKEHGGKAYNALKMLLYQGVIAYELWHDIVVPQEMIDKIYIKLKQKIYPNIVLIGFMGSGKTTVGRETAKELEMDFIDTDAYIEKKAGKTISRIFKEDGEEAFRIIETEVLNELKDKICNSVISTGGGMPLRVENAELLKQTGKVYYLNASQRTIYNRVKNNNNRPLLQCDDPYKRIGELLAQRRDKYKAASDIVIETDDYSVDQIVDMIIAGKR